MKYQILENVLIQKVITGGVWLAKHENGKAILIKGEVIPGATVTCRLEQKKKDFYQASLVKISHIPESIKLKEPVCEHFLSPFDEKFTSQTTPETTKGCWGCKRQMLDTAAQHQIKWMMIKDAFSKLPEINDIWDGWVIASPQDYYYRNKIEFSFWKLIQHTFNGQPLTTPLQQDRNCWFHKKQEFSKVLDIEQCHLISPHAHEIFKTLKKIFKESGLPVYDQKTHIGFFRHLVIRQGCNTEQFLVNLSIAEEHFVTHPDQLALRKTLQTNLNTNQWLQKNIQVFAITNNNWLADIVQGQWHTLTYLRWNGYLYEELNLGNKQEETSSKLRLAISPFSFFQVNTQGAQILLNKAASMIGHIEGTLLDLYCWTGTIGLSMLAQGKGEKLIGIEIVESAIENANMNAQLNGLSEKCIFQAGKAEVVLTKMPDLAKLAPTIQTIIVDPPREGLHTNVIEFIRNIKQQQHIKLLYISCNPQTLARDITLLKADERFALKNYTAVDLFPQTHHVESISVLR